MKLRFNQFPKLGVLGSLVLALAGTQAQAADPTGGFFAHINQQNVTGFGDSRRSVTFYDTDDIAGGSPSPLFSVHIPGEFIDGTSYNGEELEAIATDPTTGDVYILAFDNVDTDGGQSVGDLEADGQGGFDTVGDLDLYRINFATVYDHWSSNFEGTTVTNGVTAGVGGTAPYIPAGAAAGGFDDYVTYSTVTQQDLGGGNHFDPFNEGHSNTFTLAGAVEKVGEIKRNDGEGFYDYSLEFVDSDTLVMIDDSAAEDAVESAATDHAYRIIKRVSTSSGAADDSSADHLDGGYNQGTTESWESTNIALVNQDFVGGIATGHSEPESMAFHEDVVSGVRGFWVTESDSSSTGRGDDIAFLEIDANGNSLGYREHAVGAGPTFPTSFALDDDPFVDSSLNDGQADHIFVDADTGDLIIIESGFGDSGIGTIGADHEPSVIRREVLSYDDGNGRIQFGAWGEKEILNPQKDGPSDAGFLERGHWAAYDSENDLVYFFNPSGSSSDYDYGPNGIDDGGAGDDIAAPFESDLYVLDVNTGITTSLNNVDDSVSLFFGDSFGDVADYFFIEDPTLAGDFNGDGIVDAADYATWRNNLGDADESNINGAGDGSNGVDIEDYYVWRDNYGATAGPGSGASGVVIPEPSGAALLLIALAGFARRRRV